MAARKRDYKVEYARRNARAKAQGWSSYGQQRRAYAKVRHSPSWRYFRNQIDGSSAREDEIVKAFYMLGTETDADYGPDSWHYYLFVDLLEYMTAEEWLTHYPEGVRDYGIR